MFRCLTFRWIFCTLYHNLLPPVKKLYIRPSTRSSPRLERIVEPYCLMQGSERLNIYSFGAKNPRLQICHKVEKKLRNILDGREVVVQALEIDEISRASIRVPDRDICAEMENRELALTFNFKELSSDCQISLLVGADYYWDLIKGFQRLNSSLVAIETIFG
ncbi:integrase catalytic domain-containing protein [Nephila pilipes]|uniref:Integrase catalytic domain-containing protein n=1 Tax=Nephila pilipes TaxID=299642 RepID=A0A8X6J0U9_NEPPI|nr:integrase catalytic domain-containing protein [Nephila pilipes]